MSAQLPRFGESMWELESPASIGTATRSAVGRRHLTANEATTVSWTSWPRGEALAIVWHDAEVPPVLCRRTFQFWVRLQWNWEVRETRMIFDKTIKRASSPSPLPP